MKVMARAGTALGILAIVFASSRQPVHAQDASGKQSATVADAPWDLSKKPYYYSFGPDEDTSKIKMTGTWSLTEKGALLPGAKRAIQVTAAKATEKAAAGARVGGEESWLFSAPFALKAGEEYEAGVIYRLALDGGAALPKKQDGNAIHRLALRIGNAQTAEAQKQTLLQWGVANTDYQPVRVSFRAPADGTYYFSIQATSPVGAPGAVILGKNGASRPGQMEGF